MRGVISFVIVAFLTGCSFSKQIEEAKQLDFGESKNYTALQVEILNAVRAKDISSLNKALSGIKYEDMSFSKSADTPMKLAFKSGDAEISEILMKHAVDTYNFGDEQNKWESQLFEANFRRALINSDRNQAAVLVENDALNFVGEEYQKLFENAFALDGSVLIKSLRDIRSRGMTCEAFELNLILATIYLDENIATRQAVVKFLKNLRCPYTNSGDAIQRLYRVEMLKQVSNAFKDISLLQYLNSHGALATAMIEIIPGIYLGPSLLYRVANSPEAEMRSPYDADNFQELQSQFKSLGLKNSDYEFIKINKDLTRVGFRIFPRQPQMRNPPEDPLFKGIILFATGRDVRFLSNAFTSLNPLQFITNGSLPYYPSLGGAFDDLERLEKDLIEIETGRIEGDNVNPVYPIELQDGEVPKVPKYKIPDYQNTGGTWEGVVFDIPALVPPPSEHDVDAGTAEEAFPPVPEPVAESN